MKSCTFKYDRWKARLMVSDLICEAWLGPGYAMTSQTNIVKPGGKAQEPHRDFRKPRASPCGQQIDV